MSLTLSINITEFNLEITDIVWRNTVILSTSDAYTITNSSLDAPVGTAMLFLESVTSPVEYRGIYRVTVTNPAGSDTSFFNVSVTSEFKNWIIIMHCIYRHHFSEFLDLTFCRPIGIPVYR